MTTKLDLRLALERQKNKSRRANERADAAEAQVRKLKSELDYRTKQHQLMYNSLYSTLSCYGPKL